MKWLTEQEICAFLNKHDYNVRLSGNARWIDQKCTPDVITIVADCMLQYSNENPHEEFSSVDIWHNQYTVANVEDLFRKPNPDNIKAQNEYDKFFQQPMEMFAYAGILQKEKRGNRNFYSIADYDILEFIALRERNALAFLFLYIEKVLDDSNILDIFEIFFEQQSKNAYESVKEAFSNFTIQYTPINTKVECRRIFTKILNPLAYSKRSKGTHRGHLSKHLITYDMLMYNRDNFRDIYSEKPKHLTRKQYEKQIKFKPNISYNAYLSQKAKRFLRIFNDTFRNGRSEIYDDIHKQDHATHIHHIFAESEYPKISMMLENLIALTPTQHLNYAHADGNTQKIDIQYQHICLLAKTESINNNISNSKEENIYKFPDFMYVLEIGFNDTSFSYIDNLDFNSTIQKINLCYGKK